MRRGCTLVRTSVFLIGKAVSRKGRSRRWLTQRMSCLLEGVPIRQQSHVAVSGSDEGNSDGETVGGEARRNRQFGPTRQAGDPMAKVAKQPA